MAAYAVLLIAVLSRVLPHALHSTAWNFTAVGGSLLFFGSRMRTGSKTAIAGKLVSMLAILMATDYFLTVAVYQYPFHTQWYLVTWAWYAAIALLGMGLLRKPSVLRVIAGALAAPTSFFLLSNGAVWASGGMYPQTLSGLGACYVAGLPFYRNDLVSTAITVSVLFALPVLAAKIEESLHAAQNNNLPAA